eukprot:CAMPEP_0178957676 /NCGR_PEP_ID=MMETSP0789-20121207/11076_1 /TAXON_ID=3005 /ORGANISM="Rhizosolenia setigera, Strain CCMP 1694" /LENGTH=1377 /DNA_ID=CAMNT_0020640011 /DNA_START=824 /DNA_END=4958 /DNA_ORIENTATION=-
MASDYKDSSILNRSFQGVLNRNNEYFRTKQSDGKLGIVEFIRTRYLNNKREYVVNKNNEIVYDGNDSLTATKIKLKRIRWLGLDSIKEGSWTDMEVIGPQTLSNSFEWHFLQMKMDLRIIMQPSSGPDSIVVQSNYNKVVEDITVSVEMKDIVNQNAYLIGLELDKIKSENFVLSEVLNAENVIPCLFKHQAFYEVDTPSYMEMIPGSYLHPEMEGFISQGADQVMYDTSAALHEMFYHSTLDMLPNLFATDIREQMSTIFAQYIEYRQANPFAGDFPTCPSVSVASTSNNNDDDVIVNLRDLFYSERYGNVPFRTRSNWNSLYYEENGINENLIVPLTSKQSGVDGKISIPMIAQQEEAENNNNNNETSSSSSVTPANFQINKFEMMNVDSISAETFMEPGLSSENNNILENEFRIGNGKPFETKLEILLVGDEDDEKENDLFSFSGKFVNVHVITSLLMNILEESMMQYPIIDLDNRNCWLAMIPPPSPMSSQKGETNFSITDFDIQAYENVELSLDCNICNSPGSQELPHMMSRMMKSKTTVNNSTDDSSYESVFFEKFLLILREYILSTNTQQFMDDMLYNAHSNCPHSIIHKLLKVQDIGNNIVSSGYPEDGLANILSQHNHHHQRSSETTNSKNIFFDEENTKVPFQLSYKHDHLDFLMLTFGMVSQMALVRSIINKNSISATLDDIVSNEGEEESFMNISLVENTIGVYLNNRLSKESSIMLLEQSNILDEEGSLDLLRNATSLGDISLGEIVMSLHSAKLKGFDTVQKVSVFQPVLDSHTTTTNHIAFSELVLEVELKLSSSSSSSSSSDFVKIIVPIKDIELNIDLFLGISETRFQSILLGSILYSDLMFSCLIQTIESASIPKVKSTNNIMRLGDVSIQASTKILSEQSKQMLVDSLHDNFQTYLSNFTMAFENTLKDQLNNIIKDRMLIKEEDNSTGQSNTCVFPFESTDDKDEDEEEVLDLRDLLLNASAAIEFGGEGGSPYGDIVYLLMDSINQKFISPATYDDDNNKEEEGVPSINQYIQSHIATSNDPTTNTSIWNQTTDIKFQAVLQEGENAPMDIHISNIYIHNIDSLNYPIYFLQPRENEPHVVDNAITSGANSQKLEGHVQVFLFDDSDEEEEELKVTFAFQNTTLLPSIYALVQKQTFVNFPLLEINNPYCWLATMKALEPYVDEETGEVESSSCGDGYEGATLQIESFDMIYDDMQFEIECVSSNNCSPKINLLNSVLGNPIFLKRQIQNFVMGESMQDLLFRLQYQSFLQCPFHAGFERKCAKGSSAGASVSVETEVNLTNVLTDAHNAEMNKNVELQNKKFIIISFGVAGVMIAILIGIFATVAYKKRKKNRAGQSDKESDTFNLEDCDLAVKL